MMYRDRWKDAALREHQRANGRHMSVREGFAMALHRTICNIAARSTGLANKSDMHRSTVCDWEVKLRAALVEHTRFFYRTASEMIEYCSASAIVDGPPTTPVICLHRYRADATNSCIWQKNKLHALELTSRYVFDELPASGCFDDVLIHDSGAHFADLQVCPHDNSSGEASYALISKQILSLGAPLWSLPVASSGSRDVFAIWVITTDDGSDENKSRRLITEVCNDHHTTLVFEGECLKHQYQLGVQTGIDGGDSLLAAIGGNAASYYATLAKLMNIWRENAMKIHNVFQQHHGSLRASSCTTKVPPKCISGRWGSVTECEDRVLCTTMEELLPVLVIALSRHTTSSTSSKSTPLQTKPHKEVVVGSAYK